MKKIAHLVSVDPGKETGVALLSVYKLDTPDERLTNSPVTTHPYVSGYGLELHRTDSVQFDDLPEHIDDVLESLEVLYRDTKLPGVVVCEHFVQTRTSAMGQASWSLEGIGMVKALSKVRQNARPFPMVRDFSQKSADAKPNVTNPRLTEMGLKRRGDKKTDHELDALRHAVLWTARLRNRRVTLPATVI